MKIHCIIIEDEPPAQRVLKKHIAELPFLKLEGTYTNPVDAMPSITENAIGLIFLDIQLPKLNGFNFLGTLQNPPAVIITTAFPEHAAKGFEFNVSDYLVKPISFERFFKAVSKIKNEFPRLGTLSEQESDVYFTFIKSDNTIYKIIFSEIEYIKSDKDYIKIVTASDSFLIIQTLKYWENLLPTKLFCRVHKSYIVNLAKIKTIVGNQIKLESEIIPIGRTFKQSFQSKIEELM